MRRLLPFGGACARVRFLAPKSLGHTRERNALGRATKGRQRPACALGGGFFIVAEREYDNNNNDKKSHRLRPIF